MQKLNENRQAIEEINTWMFQDATVSNSVSLARCYIFGSCCNYGFSVASYEFELTIKVMEVNLAVVSLM